MKKILHIITLTKSWLHDGTENLCFIPEHKGYHCYRKDRVGGGVSIFVNDNIKSEPIDVNVSNDIFECIGVCLTFNNTTTNIVGIYRPPQVIMIVLMIVLKISL